MNGRPWRIVLVGSVVLNIFLLGAIAGGAYQWLTARGLTAAADAQQHALRFAARDLSAERQKQFAASLKAARRDSRPFAQAGQAGRREVLQWLAAPQFDRAALDAALARTRDADIAQRVRVEDGVADFAATLSPDERVKFADSLKLHGQWRQPAQAPQPASR
jgi:uncharacterized membrane protein